MPTIKRICVIGGIENEENTKFISAANNLGRVIAAKKIALIYGGGIRGLQGWVAASAIKKGSKVLGITLDDGNKSNITYGNEIKVPTKFDRLGAMFLNADAFIALPGGMETLEQIMAIIFWADKVTPKKPIGFLNVNGFYDHFLYFLDQAVEQKFMPHSMRNIIVSAPSAILLFEKWQHPPVVSPQIESQEIQHIDNSEPDTTLRL